MLILSFIVSCKLHGVSNLFVGFPNHMFDSLTVSNKLHGVSCVFVGGLLYVYQFIIYLLDASTS